MIELSQNTLLGLIEKLECWNSDTATIYVPENATLNVDGVKINTNDLIGGTIYGKNVKSQKDFWKKMER